MLRKLNLNFAKFRMEKGKKKKDDDLARFRMQLRLRKNVISHDVMNYENEALMNSENDEEDDRIISEEEYNKDLYDHLFNLLGGNDEEIPYFVRFFHLDSQELLLEAMKSMSNFQDFLKAALLSDHDWASFFSLTLIMLITYCDDIDFSSFADPQILEVLLLKTNDDHFYHRYISLKIITNLVIQYNEVYEFFSQNGFAEKLISATVFKNDEAKSEFKDEDNREANIFETVSYVARVITKENLISSEEAPILWNTAQFIINNGETKSVVNAIATLGYLAQNGYLEDFDEDTMDYFKIIPSDSNDALESFRFFLSCVPNVEEFFANLIERGIMDDIMYSIQYKEINSETVYMILGDLKFMCEDADFWSLTFERLKGPFRIYSRKAIVYYLTRITYSNSTDLIKEMQNHDILTDIDDLLSTQDESVIDYCLKFIEVLLNCYSKGFQTKASSFPNAITIQNDLNEILANYDEQTEEQTAQIGRILELFNQ